jgi:hypothetical protein
MVRIPVNAASSQNNTSIPNNTQVDATSTTPNSTSGTAISSKVPILGGATSSTSEETEFTREWRRRQGILQRRMQLLGLREKHEIAADGNCQFASVCSQLFNDPNEHPKLRLIVSSWLKKNANFKLPNGCTLQDFLETDRWPTWEAYAETMARDGTWGDQITLLAVAEIFKVRIVVISSVEGKNDDDMAGITVIVPTCLREQGDGEDVEPRDIESIKRLIRSPNTITLAHIHELHYTSLTPLPTPSTSRVPSLSSSPVSSLSLPAGSRPQPPVQDNTEDDSLSVDNNEDEYSSLTGVRTPTSSPPSPRRDAALWNAMESDNELSSEIDTEFSAPPSRDTVEINGRRYFLSPNSQRGTNDYHNSARSYVPAFDYLNDEDDEDDEDDVDIVDWPRPFDRTRRFRRSRPSVMTSPYLPFF